jgi:hypothetical protein
MLRRARRLRAALGRGGGTAVGGRHDPPQPRDLHALAAAGALLFRLRRQVAALFHHISRTAATGSS